MRNSKPDETEGIKMIFPDGYLPADVIKQIRAAEKHLHAAQAALPERFKHIELLLWRLSVDLEVLAETWEQR